jgi:hypothetical protein
MRTLIVATGLLVCLAAQAGRAAEATKADADAAFARLKSLAGEWKSEDGHETLAYELVAGGTALLEREVSADRPTMLTLYHRDGDRLVLTHYCMAGNQPRMVARPFDAADSALAFEFLDATNLASAAAGHMHGTTIHFIDDNHIATEWQFYQDGKAAMTVRARYARVR